MSCFSYFLPLTLFAVLLVCSGCGVDTAPEIVSAHGEVTLDGEPVERGMIQFIPTGETAGQSTGASITDGRYEVQADSWPLVSGSYAVRITALRKTGETGPNSLDPGAPPVPLEENYIPAVYNSRSRLTITVSEPDGENTFDFHLK